MLVAHRRAVAGRASSSEQWIEAGDARCSGARLNGESGLAADPGRCDAWGLGARAPDCEPTGVRIQVSEVKQLHEMRSVRSLVGAVLASVVLVVPGVALVAGRVLVVGNSTCTHIGRLPNPDNDVRDMSAALRRLGFEVTTDLDAQSAEFLAETTNLGSDEEGRFCYFPSSTCSVRSGSGHATVRVPAGPRCR